MERPVVGDAFPHGTHGPALIAAARDDHERYAARLFAQLLQDIERNSLIGRGRREIETASIAWYGSLRSHRGAARGGTRAGIDCRLRPAFADDVRELQAQLEFIVHDQETRALRAWNRCRESACRDCVAGAVMRGFGNEGYCLPRRKEILKRARWATGCPSTSTGS